MKTVLITGANQGIGFEVARQLAALGYKVYMGYRNATKGAQAVEKLRAEGYKEIHGMVLDVTDIESILAARQKLESENQTLDLLINNAAIAGAQPQQMPTGSIANLRTVFETNFFGAVQTTQQFIPLLERSEDPRIVNVSSQMGSLTTQQHTQNSNRRLFDAYSCSKTALNAFTVMLANALKATPFKVYSVTPGLTATNLVQFKEAKPPEKGAQVIVKYATQNSDDISGKFFNEQGEVPW